ncbi:hypothetical protein PFICI_12075 [Pestalotiopsis fici W106-1]|uniref:Protein kinase domain-containing protein n=1 Tax=Pestalotiopsis fici (strain W106-1 / CGMCC3.15140) TaxID=1229662 RepID=W3WS68_PESFW|nr:uncharacterized protein PFICI_12075 [Pestalotiopsis fici W106-1]ETS76688.1 hypothetical protein PFICI_12075 [Pestalotiopsis fici W106-1]
MEAYKNEVRLENYLFYKFRKSGRNPFRPANLAGVQSKADYINLGFHNVPRANRLPIFQDIQVKAPKTWQHGPRILSGNNLLGPPLPPADANYNLQTALNTKTLYFDQQAPQWTPIKVLARGGYAMAVHYKHNVNGVDRDIVSKIGLNARGAESLRQRQAAHSIQLYDVPGLRARPTRPPEPLSDDSSDDQLTEYDDDGVGDPRPWRVRRPRRNRSWLEDDAKNRAHESRRQAYDAWMSANPNPNDDWLLLEYMENGSLSELIKRRTERADPNPPPNRVLWAFWLCLVRGVVGLQYPPNMFHPNRRNPARRFLGSERAPPPGTLRRSRRLRHQDPLPHAEYDATNARSNRLLRAVSVLDVRSWQYSPAAVNRHTDLAGDLIEELPETNELCERGENTVHFDLDPNNILIGGFELSPEALLRWGERIKKGLYKEGKPIESIPSTPPRPDRQAQEHAFLADFGLAERIKSYKKNRYYHRRRRNGKVFIAPPEQFGPEWETLNGNPSDDDVGEDDVAGSYSFKTNIWQIAWNMWMLITGLAPPSPPKPVFPPDQNHHITASTPRSQYHTILQNVGYNGPISYCAILCDSIDSPADPFASVDQDLRWTIFRCLYHCPHHRPNLNELLDQAKEKIGPNIFPGETDAQINTWVENWFYSAPPPPPPPPPPSGGGGGGGGDDGDDGDDVSSGGGGPGGGGPGGGGPGGGGPGGGGPGGGGPGGGGGGPGGTLSLSGTGLWVNIRYNAAFPSGYRRIMTPGTNAQCGIRALVESVQHQFPATDLPAGVNFPTFADFMATATTLEGEGLWNVVGAAGLTGSTASGNWGYDQLYAILSRWSTDNNVNTSGINTGLGSVVVMSGQANFLWLGDSSDYYPIFIYNDNAGANNGGGSHVPIMNHYEGLMQVPNESEKGKGKGKAKK